MSENTSLVSKGHLDGVVSQFVTGPELNAKQDKLTSANAGDNVTITEGSTGVKISASGGSKWIKDDKNGKDTDVLILGLGSDGTYVGSVFVVGPVYDENGKEIVGGGSKWISDSVVDGKSVLSLGSDSAGNWVHSIYMKGPIISLDEWVAIEFTRKGIVLNELYTSNSGKLALGVASDGTLLHSYVVTDDSKNLSIGAEKGKAVRIVARNTSGQEKAAEITYENIDKLINLLNS